MAGIQRQEWREALTLRGRRRWSSGAALGLLMIAVLTSCSGGSGSEMREQPAANVNQINALPRDQVQDGGTLTWPLDNIPPNFNFNQVDGTEEVNYRVISALMPTVYTTDAVGQSIWNPNYLAEEPTLTVEPRQVVTYRINPKAAWDDGTPITWEDFYWQWKALNGKDIRFQIASSTGYSAIESVVRGADDREVIVTYERPFSDWQSVFSPLYPASTNQDPALFNQGWTKKPLLTAGPFRLDGIDATAQTITLVRNEKWWGNPAKLDRIVFRAIVPDAQVDAIANGEVDLVDIGPDANKYERAKVITNTEIRVAGGPNFRHITINGTSPLLQDQRVRQAVAMAIDRGAIASAMLTPLGINPAPLGNHIFMANQAGYRDNSGQVGSYSPEKAAELLDEAGWKLEGSKRRKDGVELKLTMVIPSAVATSRQEASLIQNMLAQAGITLEISTVPGPDFFSKYIQPGQFDLTLFSWIGTAYPLSSTNSIYAKPVIGPDGKLNIQQNYARIGSEAIDSLMEAASGELVHARAIEMANQLDSMIWEEVHSLTLYQRPTLWVVKKNLANFGAFGFQIPATYEDIGWAKE